MIEVLVAIVGGAGFVSVALISNRGRQHAKAARVQVENNHRDADGNVINLREEGDERHTANTQLLKQLIAAQHAIQGDIRGIRRDIGRLMDADASHADRIHQLEKTQPKPKKGTAL